MEQCLRPYSASGRGCYYFYQGLSYFSDHNILLVTSSSRKIFRNISLFLHDFDWSTLIKLNINKYLPYTITCLQGYRLTFNNLETVEKIFSYPENDINLSHDQSKLGHTETSFRIVSKLAVKHTNILLRPDIILIIIAVSWMSCISQCAIIECLMALWSLRPVTHIGRFSFAQNEYKLRPACTLCSANPSLFYQHSSVAKLQRRQYSLVEYASTYECRVYNSLSILSF